MSYISSSTKIGNTNRGVLAFSFKDGDGLYSSLIEDLDLINIFWLANFISKVSSPFSMIDSTSNNCGMLDMVSSFNSHVSGNFISSHFSALGTIVICLILAE